MWGNRLNNIVVDVSNGMNMPFTGLVGEAALSESTYYGIDDAPYMLFVVVILNGGIWLLRG